MSQETNDTALGGAFGGEGEGLVQTNPEVEASQDPTITKIVTEDNSLGGTFGSDESPLAQSLSGEAATAAGEAQASEEAAQISATNAANSASAAATSATNASTSETNAATSATDASLSETNAVTSAYTATTKANEASTSATNASTSATNAATSATNAATSETNAATSATNASNSDASSLLNAQEAQSSASQASTSASNAAGSATLAGTHKDAAEDAQGASETARDQAQTYATNSQTSATQSEASATAAATSASEASDSETNAATSETNASTSATNASNSATASANSATQAANSATQAATSATNAATSATNAFTSETNAATSATNSSDSATASATSASEASTSASNALTSEGNASDSATASATSATNAATSATNASTSEGNAATSATNAATSETNAATSATNAATSATNAATSATESSDSAGDSSVSATQSATSATNAATSATNAATSETNAATSESNAAASASEASVSEGNAEASANNASTSATNAANSATAASNSASAAATSASNAASSASAASSSAANASVSETNAANLLDQFEDIYLGSKTSDPTLDNDGDTLQVGSLYFNSTTNDLKIWTGSVWTQVLVDAELQTIVDDAIADLIDSAPTALNTLNELAAALGDDPNFSATISNQIGTLQNDVATLGNIKYEEGDDISVSSVTLEGAATGVGLISWDATNETASMTMGNGVTQQIGEELYYPKRTRNMTGFTIPNGTPVMLVGGVGEDSYIAPAIADGSIPHEYYAGLTTEAIADGDYGRVLFFGSINDIDTSSYTKGDLLYVSDTTHGAFTTTPPEAPSHAILSAIVTKVGTTDGRLFVRVHTNPEAGEITFDNATSGLVSSSVQGAIDELQSNKASVDLLSSNITLFPTTATSPDVTNHNRLVTSKADSDYDTTAQNVATGTVTTSETLVGQLTSDAGLVEGSIAGITVTLIGNIEKLTGNNNQGAHFYFKIYRRESDGTEYLMGESFHTPTLFETDGYEQFSASVYLSNSGMSNFADTDRFVLRFYGIAEGGDCSYQFQFGGEAPVRGIVPVPVSVIPSSSAEDTPTSTTNFNGILSGTNSNVQSALDTLDDHGHAISGITGLDSALQNKVDVTGYNNTNWDTAYGWGDHDGLYLPIDAVTLPDQTGHSGQFLTTNGTDADWATVDTSLGDTAYGWGDHSLAGYSTTDTTYSIGDGGLTEKNFTTALKTKLDGIATNANNYVLPFTNNSANWNTAYGWGDHALAGYLTSLPSHNHNDLYYTESEADSRFVNTAGDTMTGTLTVPNLTIGSGSKIKFANNDYIRYDDSTNRFHFDVDGGLSNGSVKASTFIGGLSGNASTSSKWATARTNTVTLTGDASGSGSASVDGSGDWTVSVPVVVNNDSHSHSNYVTTNTNQIVTGAKELISTANHYSGHLYYDAYDANGMHYPHFLDGSGSTGVRVNWRIYNGSSLRLNTWDYNYNDFHTNVRAPIFYDNNNTAYYTDPASTGTSGKFRQFVQIGDSSSYNTNTGTWGARLNVTDDIHAKIEVGQDANGMLSHWYAHTGQSSIKFGTSTSHDVEIQRGGATQLTIHSGYARANNDFRSPIFYDSNNTAYYADPASTSNFSVLNANTLNITTLNATNLSVSGNTTLGNGNGDTTRVNDILYVQATDSGDAHFHFGENSTNGYGAYWHWDSGYRMTLNSRNAGTNTAVYYFDTNSTTYLNMGRHIHMQNKDINYVNQLHFNANVRFYDEGNDNYLNYKWGDTGAGGIKFYDGNTTLHGYIYGDGSGRFGLLDNDGAWAVRIQTGTDPLELRCNDNAEFYVYDSYTYSPGSSRAPIFYDSNNTGYYTNPASTSVLNALTVNTINGYSTGDLQRIVRKTNGTAGAGWMTVADCTSARHHGEIYVTDGESSDHSFIRIDWMRSYADSNFTVLNVGGHSNRITAVRVLRDGDITYGRKVLQVYVTASSNYYVRILTAGDTPHYGTPYAVTPVIQNSISGYPQQGSTVDNLEKASLGTDQGIRVGGEIRTPTMWVNHSTGNYNSYNENIRLFPAANSVSVIAFGATGDSGEPWQSILGYSDRLETRYRGTWEQRQYSGYVVARGSSRAPIFYDSNNTGYYSNPSSTSNFNTLNVAGGNLVNTSSNNSSGYHKCTKTGVIIQWANIYVNANNRATWTFPIAFPTACRSVSYNALLNSTGAKDNTSFYSISRTSASFVNGHGGSIPFYVMAIGY